jgi:Carboxypeptidase regulatory-like domain
MNHNALGMRWGTTPRSRRALGQAWSALSLMAMCLVLSPSTHAAAQPRTECVRCTSTGDAPDALPGLYDVPIATLRPALSGTISGSGGWGFAADDTIPGADRHRVYGGLAGSLHVLEWLSFGFRFQGRWESVFAPSGQDSGLVGWPTLTARAAFEPIAGLGIGADLSAWVYGGDAPSLEFSSASVRGRLFGSYRAELSGSSALTVSATLGGIYDGSRNAAPRAFTDQLEPADRLSLGVNDFSSVVAGLGAALRFDPVEIVAEGNWRIHVGDGAPDAGGWPLIWTLGARGRPIGEILELGGYASFRMMEARADFIAVGRPAVDIPPVVTLTLQASVRLGLGGPTELVEEPDLADEDIEQPLEPTTGGARGRIVDGSGAAVAGANVELTPAGASSAVRATTDENGQWALANLPPGSAHLHVTSEGNEPIDADIQIGAGSTFEVPTSAVVQLQPTLPLGEIRGVVQSYTGSPLEGARVRIAPSGGEHGTDADGAFLVQVPPGGYDVTISAAGHRSQTRHVEVQEHGVVLLNAQLHRGN